MGWNVSSRSSQSEECVNITVMSIIYNCETYKFHQIKYNRWYIYMHRSSGNRMKSPRKPQRNPSQEDDIITM